MSDFNLFEAHEASGDDERREAARAGDKLAAAISEVRRQFGGFLFAAADRGDFEDRVALCKDDMIRTVNAHVMPVTGTMRRVVRAVRDDWEAQRTAKSFTLNPEDPDWIGHHSEDDLADNEAYWSGPGRSETSPEQAEANMRLLRQERDRRKKGYRSAGQGDILEPEGDFHGYLDEVAPQAESKAGENFVTTGPVNEHTGDPADTDFAKAARRRSAGEMFDSFRAQYKGIPTSQLVEMYEGDSGDEDLYDDLSEELHYRAEEGDKDAARSVLNDTDVDDEDWTYETGDQGEPREARRRRAGFDDTRSIVTEFDTAAQTWADSGRDDDLEYLNQVRDELLRRAGEGDEEAAEWADSPMSSFGTPESMQETSDMLDDMGWPSIRRSRRYVAGGDPLGTAAEAITQELQEQAEQFQQAIEPLQQALQAVDYAQQVQQAQQPMNVTPDEGTVQVIPDRNPAPQPIPTGGPQGVMPQQLPPPADPSDPYGQGQQQTARRRHASDEDCPQCGGDGCDWDNYDREKGQAALCPTCKGYGSVRRGPKDDRRAAVMPDGSQSPDEAESARYVLDFMRSKGIDVLNLDDENHYPSYQRDFDDEELDDAVAWVPQELVYNGPRGERDPWNPVLRRQDLEDWFAKRQASRGRRPFAGSRTKQAGVEDSFRQQYTGIPTGHLVKWYEDASANGEDKADDLFEELHYRMEENDQEAAKAISNDYNVDDDDWTYATGYDGDDVAEGYGPKEGRRRRAGEDRGSWRGKPVKPDTDVHRWQGEEYLGVLPDEENWNPQHKPTRGASRGRRPLGDRRAQRGVPNDPTTEEDMPGWERVHGRDLKKGDMAMVGRWFGKVTDVKPHKSGKGVWVDLTNDGRYIRLPGRTWRMLPETIAKETPWVLEDDADRPRGPRRTDQDGNLIEGRRTAGDWGNQGRPQTGKECENCGSTAIEGGVCQFCGEGGPRLSDPKKWPANVVERDKKRSSRGRRPLGDRAAAIQKNWWQQAGGGPIAKAKPAKMPKYPGTPTPPKPKTMQAAAEERKAARSVGLIGTGSVHRPEGWEWDRHLLAFKANGPRLFTCACGTDLDMPGYRKCGGCGKIWNGYAIGHGGDTRTAQADTYLVREVPVRKDVILASRRERAIREANKRLVEGRHRLEDRPVPRLVPVEPMQGLIGGEYDLEDDSDPEWYRDLVRGMHPKRRPSHDPKRAGRMAQAAGGLQWERGPDGRSHRSQHDGVTYTISRDPDWPNHWSLSSYETAGVRGGGGGRTRRFRTVEKAKAGAEDWASYPALPREGGRMKDLWMQEREAAGEDPEWEWPSEVGQEVPKVSQPPVDWHRRDSGGKWTPPGVPAKKGKKAMGAGPIKVRRFRRNDYVGSPIWGFDSPERPIREGDQVWIDHPLNGFPDEPDRDPLRFTVAVEPNYKSWNGDVPHPRFKAIDQYGDFAGYFD